MILLQNGGWGGIQTHGAFGTAVFKTATIDRSVTHPFSFESCPLAAQRNVS
jgi:hypothetical protein